MTTKTFRSRVHTRKNMGFVTQHWCDTLCYYDQNRALRFLFSLHHSLIDYLLRHTKLVWKFGKGLKRSRSVLANHENPSKMGVSLEVAHNVASLLLSFLEEGRRELILKAVTLLPAASRLGFCEILRDITNLFIAQTQSWSSGQLTCVFSQFLLLKSTFLPSPDVFHKLPNITLASWNSVAIIIKKLVFYRWL